MDMRENANGYYPRACRKDTREDSGNYYPGGTVVPQGKVPSGSSDCVMKQKGLEVKTNSISDLREAVKELAKALGATVVSAFASIVCVAAEVQTAKLGELDLDAQPRVVTNVTFEGLAFEKDLATKRDKSDLSVYAEQWQLPAEALPVTLDGVVVKTIKLTPDRYGSSSINIELDGEYCGDFDENGEFIGSAPDVKFAGKYGVTIDTKWPCLVKVTSPIDTIATMSAVTNAARAVVNTVWDPALGVAWEARMHNGALYYVAVTNRQEVAK